MDFVLDLIMCLASRFYLRERIPQSSKCYAKFLEG